MLPLFARTTTLKKNKELDRFRSGLRMPFEGTFSKQNHHAPYRGHAEVTLQAFMQAPTYN